MKLKEIFIIAILIGIGAYLIYNEHRIAKEAQQTEQIIYQMDEEVTDYLVVGSKDAVNKILEDYYKDNPINTVKKDYPKPAAKNIPISKINLHDIKIIDKIAIYIKKKEGFRSKAYKDNTQYSIGYGTRATSKTEIITRKEANTRLYKHIRRVIVPAFKDVKFNSIEQLYSAIDFSYNLGHNRFKREIVNEDGYIDCYKMMSYNKVRDKQGNLVYNEGLAQRRFENFLNCASSEVIGVIND